MAGGRGKRIAAISDGVPKPMIKIYGKPILEYEIECLRNQGFKDLIITVSHLGKVIMDYFGDGSSISPVTGKPFGVNIEYFNEEKPLGNAGALYKIKEKLTEDFLLINGDSVFDVDFQRFIAFHKVHGGIVTIFTHPNSHPYDSGLIIADDYNKVKHWIDRGDKRRRYYKNRVNAGLHIINPKIFNTIDIDLEHIGAENGKNVKIDLDRDLLKPLAKMGQMYCYDSPEYVKDMGTPERLEAVCNDLKTGRVSIKNLHRKQKAIFLDRDGTINKYVGFLTDIEEFELMEGVATAISMINNSSYLCIVVTNQPIIARGDVTVGELDAIHNKMETLLGDEGAYINAIYYCPHHPDGGFKGEIKELKISCNCRKPKPGMLLKAAKDYNIDLSASWMIGDEEKDIKAGKAAGCKTALVGIEDYGQDETANTLEELIKRIKEREKD